VRGEVLAGGGTEGSVALNIHTTALNIHTTALNVHSPRR